MKTGGIVPNKGLDRESVKKHLERRVVPQVFRSCVTPKTPWETRLGRLGASDMAAIMALAPSLFQSWTNSSTTLPSAVLPDTDLNIPFRLHVKSSVTDVCVELLRPFTILYNFIFRSLPCLRRTHPPLQSYQPRPCQVLQ